MRFSLILALIVTTKLNEGVFFRDMYNQYMV